MKYDFGYKHVQLIVNKMEIVIELSFDNMLGKGIFSAKSNLMFQDDFGTWGHAVGVGATENEALTKCICEIQNYTHCNISFNHLVELVLPKRVTFIYKKKTIVLNIEQHQKAFSILTPNGRKNIIADDIIKYISNNRKEFSSDNINDYSEELFKTYNFKKPFYAMTKKYET